MFLDYIIISAIKLNNLKSMNLYLKSVDSELKKFEFSSIKVWIHEKEFTLFLLSVTKTVV